MPEHIIYYFSGTGNSLKTALSIQKALGTCDVVPMGSRPVNKASGSVKSVGFVFPCYFGGIPHRVQEFVTSRVLSELKPDYIYAVVTYGAVLGGSLSHLDELLDSTGHTLDYAAGLKSFANYVVMYNMSDKVAEKTAQTKVDLQAIITDIKEQRSGTVKKTSSLLRVYNRSVSKDIARQDQYFVVQKSCDGCALCAKVCPVQNVVMVEGTPQWQGRCEQCLACLQWCPKRAIDYGKKTVKRGRYTHPEITSRMFIEHLNGAGSAEQD